MKSTNIDFIINIAKLNAVLSKSLDGELGGIGLTEFIVLYYLYDDSDNKLRRIDLAHKTWISPSWITRLLQPMEKMWITNKVSDTHDARVSFVVLTANWKEIFKNSVDIMKDFTNRNIPDNKKSEIKQFTKIMWKIGWNIMWK